MSRTFSTKNGSEESLNVSRRCGFRPKACQMRDDGGLRQAQLARQAARAPVRRRRPGLQGAVTACSTWASVTVRGAPGRGSRPDRRAAW